MKMITVIALGVFAMLALAQSESRIAAAPATAPSTQAAPGKADFTVVHRGDIRLDIHADGYLEPVGALEVRIDPKAYTGELKIGAIADNGAHVKKGDTLLRIDSDEYDRQLVAAQNDAVLAHANLDKAKSDVALGEKADTLAMNMQKEHQAEADGSVNWWEKVDGPIQLTIADFSAREADFQLQDSEEQLDELKKMYKSEELTNETTDIVMKRAIQEIELGKISDTVYHEQADEFSKFHYDFLHKRVTDEAGAADQLTDELQAQQAQSKTVRQTSLAGAQSVADAADRKVADLKADGKRLSVAAPADGVVLYGQLVSGNWQNDDEQALRVGQNVQPKQVMLTFFTPGKIRGTVELTESQFFSVPPGAKAMLTPAAFAGLSLSGTCDQSVPQGHATQTGVQYSMRVALPASDDRLIPGMRSAVSISADLAKNVLIIPLTAISAGQVWVRDASGETKARDVALGASDGTNIEVKTGLVDGDTVLTHAKK
jgi:multidrug efflux pump subunit AcrA (membrane-fusion protein)